MITPKKAARSSRLEAFPQSLRVTSSADFARAKKIGRRIGTRDLQIVIAPNNLNIARLGLVVPKTVDKRAAVRNKIKRRLRDIFRRNKSVWREGFDIIVIARKNTANLAFAELKEQFLKAFSGTSRNK